MSLMRSVEGRFEFKPAYDDEGKCSWSRAEYLRAAGVYIISLNGLIMYVGKSGSRLYDMAYRHFQAWIKQNRARRYNDTYFSRELGYDMALIKTDDPCQLEVELIWELKPIKNKNYYGMQKAGSAFSLKTKVSAFQEDYDLLEIWEQEQDNF